MIILNIYNKFATMSTYIHGYIMKNISLKELTNFNIKHKIEFDTIKTKAFRKKLIKYFIKEYDEMTFKIIKKTDKIGKNILDSIINEIEYELCNPKANIYNKYHDMIFDLKAIYYPLNKKYILVTFPYVFKEASIYIDNIVEFSDYSYQNSTDKPSDISTKDWNKRIKDWDIVFDNDICKNGYGDINSGGLQYEFCNKHLKYNDYELNIDMLDYIPTNDIRCEKIAAQLFYEQYLNNITKNNTLKLETHEYTKHFYDVRALIKKKDSVYITIYNDILPKLHNIDMETLENAVYVI